MTQQPARSRPQARLLNLVFFEQPGNGVSGSPFRPQPVVAVEDAAGNVVSSDLSDVTLTLNTVSGPAGATLSSTCTGSEFFGIVTFSNCSILKAGTYTVTATDTSLPGFSVTSTPFTVSFGPPSQLVFTTQPNNSTGGVAFPTQPVVTVEDVGGNVVTNDASTVTLAITSGTGTAGAALSGCAGTETNGAVAFAGCAINKAGSGYTLTATDGSLTPATSAGLTVSRGPATQLGFTTSPGASTTGNALTPQPVVTVEDAGGNPATTNPNASITLAIGTQPGTGATLACTGSTTKSATGGVATFAGCKITVATAGSFSLNATAPGLLTGKSAAFTVAGAASKLVFTMSPTNSAGGVTFVTQPTVTVEDSLGNVVTADTSTVTLAIATQPGSGASLVCNPNTNRQTAAGGVATFAGCKITLGSGTPGTYSLGATDGTLLPATSSPFTVSGPPTHLVFTQQPGGSTGGVAFGSQPIVTVEDAGGNTVTSDTSTVNLAIAAGTGTTGATLSGCSETETLGVVTLTGCSIDKAGTGYALRATDGTLTATTSTPFNITVGAAAQLAFGTQPGGGPNGATWGTQPTVSVQDSGGNVVTTATNPVTLGIASQPGSGATLACNANPQTPAGGVATFAGCQITGKAGTYTLSASATGLSGATSSSFNLSVGAAAQLAFSTQPGGGANGATWSTQPAVSVEDSGGNVVSTNNTASITLAIATQPAGGGTLFCSANPKTAAGGVATFAGCKITGKAGSYTLSASGAGFSATSNSFNLTAGAASQLAFSTQPGGGANGATWSTQPAVSIEDASGNVTNGGSNITLAIASQPGSGASLTCSSNPQGANAGVATFTGCQITGKAGNYTLSASGAGFSTTSTPFNITVGAAAQLAFGTQPGGGPNGATWGTQPTVSVQDSGGNVVTTATNPVTLGIASQPGSGATLACNANPQTPAGGVATFAGCQITGKAGTYTLSASATGLSGATSSSFNLSVGAAAQLAFSTQPGGGANGATWSTQPAVSVEDSGGNVVSTNNTASITLAIATQPAGGGTLFCSANPKTAAGGVATFAGCKITGKAGSYTLSASGAGFSATSNSFNLTAGAASQLAFSTQPGGGANGATWSTQPAVSIEDASGNVTNGGSNITLAIASQPGSGASLTCSSNPQGANAGVATFTGCQITGKAGNYTLSASGAGFSTTSTPFNITVGAAAQLAFGTQPGGGPNGATWGTQPTVSVQDSGGNVVTTATNPVTLGIASQPGSGATLACSANPQTPAGGVATFAGCQITGKAGTYTLSASATGLSGATSSSFNLSVGAAAQLAFSTQPGGGANGATWSTQPAVSVEDSGGNVVSTNNTASVTLAIATQPAGGGTLFCSANPKTAAGGVATFAGCKITGKAGSYTLSASGAGFSATSNSFNLTAGAASQLAFSTQPGGGANGATWSTQPAVSIEDASGNVTNGGSNITLAIASQPGSGASLTCSSNPQGANAGVATFTGCQITGKAGNYTLSASGAGFSTTSTPFNITVGAAAQLAFGTQPGGGPNGATWGTQPTVSVQDSGGNVVTTATNPVTLGIASQPGSGATLACSANPQTPAGGVATFAGCQITGKAGTYTLSASATGLSGATSSSFNLSVGAAAQLAFSTQPGGGANGATWSTQPAVSVEDSGGNVVSTNNTASITLAIATQPAGGGTLFCSANPKTAAGGVATFAGCKITGKAGSYTLSASGAGFSATSNSFNLTAGAASQLAFSTQPGGGANGATWSTQPAVSIEDASGNVTNGGSNITLAIASQPGSGASLTCSSNPQGANAGVATFTGCQITGKAGNYTLSASGAGFSTTSTPFNITVGAAAQLAFGTQPGGGPNGATWGTQPTVSVQDSGGNVVTTATNPVTLGIASQPGSGATLACNANPQTPAGGVATFAGCQITGKAGTYTLSASATGLSGATSSSFNLSVGAAAQLAFSTQPGGGANGATWSTQPAVSVEDSGGNVVSTNNTASITLAIATQPRNGATLTCNTNPKTAANGVATFTGCQITGRKGAYTLSASANGLASAISNGFNET